MSKGHLLLLMVISIIWGSYSIIIGVVALGLAVYEYVKGGQTPGSTSSSGSNLPGWLQSLENFNQGGTLIKW